MSLTRWLDADLTFAQALNNVLVQRSLVYRAGLISLAC